MAAITTIFAFGLMAAANAYRVVKPEGNARQASQEEMLSYMDGDIDLVLLGGAGVLLLTSIMHFYAGWGRLAGGSALAGVAAALQALGLLDGAVFGAAVAVGVAAATISTLVAIFAPPKPSPKKVE
eukprot:gb/GFBE01063667.1/.p1 GENE.gb/GFBE01063667.1/~~gb/GFBE01063667.1/.p1  ORF type:complete len:126 (+),score=38.21 gb/GFBE01063667.1/:1-378(+)